MHAIVWMIKGLAIDLLHKSHNALVAYPTMHHYVTEICTCVGEWCSVEYVWMHRGISELGLFNIKYEYIKLSWTLRFTICCLCRSLSVSTPHFLSLQILILIVSYLRIIALGWHVPQTTWQNTTCHPALPNSNGIHVDFENIHFIEEIFPCINTDLITIGRNFENM